MNGLMFIGLLLFVVSAVQLLPWIRQRVVERGLSGGVGIPLVLLGIGFVTFMVGFLRG